MPETTVAETNRKASAPQHMLRSRLRAADRDPWGTHGTEPLITFMVLTLPLDSIQPGRAEATAASPKRSRQPSAKERAMIAIARYTIYR